MSASAFEEFRERLTLDDARRAMLRAAGENGTFFEAALEMAKEWSLELTEADLVDASRRGRQSWSERFIL